MAGHARLALPDDLRNLANRKLHRPQKAENAQSRGVSQSAKNVERRGHGHSYKEFFIWVNAGYSDEKLDRNRRLSRQGLR